MGGVENVTLMINQMPMHTHASRHDLPAQARARTLPATAGRPANVPAIEAAGVTAIYSDARARRDDGGRGAPLDAARDGSAAGGNSPCRNLQPYLALNYCIALEGIFPSRN